MSDHLASAWGPLSEPIHTDPLPAGRPAFRDNAFLGFWDAGGDVFGAFHVSTSPNAEGRRARFAGIIQEMHDDGTLTELSMKWYDEDLTQNPTG